MADSTAHGDGDQPWRRTAIQTFWNTFFTVYWKSKIRK